MGSDPHPQKQKGNTKKVDKDIFWKWEIRILQLSFFHSRRNSCFPRLCALLGNLPVVSWRHYLVTQPSGHAELSSCLCKVMKLVEVGNSEWCGKQRIPLPAKRNNSSEEKKCWKCSQWILRRDQNEAGKPGSPCPLILQQARNYISHLKTELNFSLK